MKTLLPPCRKIDSTVPRDIEYKMGQKGVNIKVSAVSLIYYSEEIGTVC